METRNTNQKDVGFAIHGLRAYIKALELAKNVRVSQSEFAYQIGEDRTSARIGSRFSESPAAEASKTFELNGHTYVEVDGTSRSLSEWVKVGKQARLGLIGLKAAKEELKEAGDHVQFTLNVLTGEAFLSRAGGRLEDRPATIDEWAKAGRTVEKGLFESLKAAQDYHADSAAAEVKAKMVRLGVIREPKTANDQSAQ